MKISDCCTKNIEQIVMDNKSRIIANRNPSIAEKKQMNVRYRKLRSNIAYKSNNYEQIEAVFISLTN